MDKQAIDLGMKRFRITFTLGPSRVSFEIRASGHIMASAVAEAIRNVPASLFEHADTKIEQLGAATTQTIP